MCHNWRCLASDIISHLFWRPSGKTTSVGSFDLCDLMSCRQIWGLCMFIYRSISAPMCVCVCVWRSSLSCMLQHAWWNGGFPCNTSDWSGLHYSAQHRSPSDRHKIWLLLNRLIFLVSISTEKMCLSTTGLIWVCKPVPSVWPTWILDSILALKAICSVIPNGRFSSCGCSLSPWVSSHRIFWIPAVVGQQWAMKGKETMAYSFVTNHQVWCETWSLI